MLPRGVPWRVVAAWCWIVVVVGLVGAVPALSDAPPGDGPAPAVVGADNDTTTPFNLVDVRSLIRHRFDGHGFTLVGVVHREAAFNRWAIVYTGDGLRLTGTLTVPNLPRPAPLVVVAHGYREPPGYRRGGGTSGLEDILGRAGFAVLHPDYRNFGGSTVESGRAVAHPLGYPDDLVNAVLALRHAHLRGIDLGRVGLLGRSMGGGVAMQAAVARPDMFRAIQLYSPVSSLAADDFDRWAPAGSALRARVVRAFGTPASDPAFWARASVRIYLDRIQAPVQIAHGTADPICPFDWSVATAGAMRAAGVDVDLVPYPGEGHAFHRLMPRFEVAMVRYWKAHLG